MTLDPPGQVFQPGLQFNLWRAFRGLPSWGGLLCGSAVQVCYRGSIYIFTHPDAIARCTRRRLLTVLSPLPLLCLLLSVACGIVAVFVVLQPTQTLLFCLPHLALSFCIVVDLGSRRVYCLIYLGCALNPLNNQLLSIPVFSF